MRWAKEKPPYDWGRTGWQNWHKWFAWYPVSVGESKVWLEWIERRSAGLVRYLELKEKEKHPPFYVIDWEYRITE